MKLAVFDFNGTIFPKETIPFLISCWKKFGYNKFRLYKLYLILAPLIVKYKYPFLTKMSKEEMKVEFMYKFVNIFKGMNQEDIKDYFMKVEKEASLYYNKKVIEQINEFKNKDYKVIILSGAFIELLNILGNRLKVDEVIGSTILQDSSINRYSVLSGSKKLNVLKKNYPNSKIDWDNSFVFADSIDDLKLFQTVGNPVAVNPDDKLLEIAESNKWEIIN
jgi:phosphoserine phosphatase